MERSGPARALADVVFAQWSLAGLGSAIDMNARLAADPEFAQVNRFGTHFFDIYIGSRVRGRGGLRGRLRRRDGARAAPQPQGLT